MSSSIYTKTGDDGTTGVLGGGRLPKDDARVEALGTLDELNAALGFVRALALDELPHDALGRLDPPLETIQNLLFDIGCHVATPAADRATPFPGPGTEAARWLERTIDRFDEELPPLDAFILPGGGKTAAALHAARAVCRRAERTLVTLGRDQSLDGETLKAVNRLGDLLFVVARWATQAIGNTDVKWRPRS